MPFPDIPPILDRAEAKRFRVFREAYESALEIEPVVTSLRRTNCNERAFRRFEQALQSAGYEIRRRKYKPSSTRKLRRKKR